MGKRIECDVRSTDVLFKGQTIPGLCAECGECGHEVTVGGQGEKSAKRALVKLRDECPRNEENFYIEEGDD